MKGPTRHQFSTVGGKSVWPCRASLVWTPVEIEYMPSSPGFKEKTPIDSTKWPCLNDLEKELMAKYRAPFSNVFFLDQVERTPHPRVVCCWSRNRLTLLAGRCQQPRRSELRLARTARRQHLVHIVFASSTLLMVMNDDGANQIFSYFFYYSFSFSLFIITASFNNRFRVPHTFGPRQNFKKERIINARRPSFIIIYTHKFRAVLAATLSFCVLVKLIIIRRVIHHLGQSPARFRFSYGREKMCLTGAVEFAKLWGVKRMSQQWRVNIQIRHKRS